MFGHEWSHYAWEYRGTSFSKYHPWTSVRPNGEFFWGLVTGLDLEPEWKHHLHLKTPPKSRRIFSRKCLIGFCESTHAWCCSGSLLRYVKQIWKARGLPSEPWVNKQMCKKYVRYWFKRLSNWNQSWNGANHPWVDCWGSDLFGDLSRDGSN